jgi:hypothetical protein
MNFVFLKFLGVPFWALYGANRAASGNGLFHELHHSLGLAIEVPAPPLVRLRICNFRRHGEAPVGAKKGTQQIENKYQKMQKLTASWLNLASKPL